MAEKPKAKKQKSVPCEVGLFPVEILAQVYMKRSSILRAMKSHQCSAEIYLLMVDKNASGTVGTNRKISLSRHLSFLLIDHYLLEALYGYGFPIHVKIVEW
ncbi:hypothetical protein TNCV_3931511 [Trichonephila clavipes]|nr:hypothetical protein TNCV_3931511 [Trichonephila clavipes]